MVRKQKCQLPKVYNIKKLWAKACKYDGIPPSSKFVVFSKENPHLKKYNEALTHLRKAIGKC